MFRELNAHALIRVGPSLSVTDVLTRGGNPDRVEGSKGGDG